MAEFGGRVPEREAWGVYIIIDTNRYKSQTTSPGEIKRREVSWTLKNKLAQKRSRAGRWCLAERVGLLLLQL